MNCKEFENLIGDLARRRMMQASARDAALAHAEACSRCAARLADERALSAGLKAFSASDEQKAAPAPIETALLAAFRQQQSQPSFEKTSRWPRWAWAAAAAILLAFGIVLFNVVRDKAPSGEIATTPQTPAPQPSSKPAVKSEERPEERPEERMAEAPPSPKRRAAVSTNRSQKRLQAATFIIRDELTLYAEDSETTTEFLPLDYSQNPSPMESGQLIRVQMPRSALVKFGLPVNVERAEAPVKADLLVGEDGLARAIRFVR